MEKTFIILSSCDWGNMLQRPHHLARALAKLGHKVHFIETSFLQQEATINFSKDKYVSFCKENMRLVENVFIYKSANIFRENSFIYNNRTYLIQDLINTASDTPVILTYFPSHIKLLNSLKGEFKVVYDCVDDHCDLEYSYWSSGSDIEDEQLMLNIANITLTTSTALFLQKGYRRNNVFLSMNAVNEEDFGVDLLIPEPDDLKGIPYPRVCYMGAVFNWFNEVLFYSLIEHNPDKSFVVLGPVAGNLLTREYPNLYVLGTKKHQDLKSYLNHMDVGIIPFKDDIDLIINCNPIKMYEYLACNLPVVSTALPDVGLDKEYIRIASQFEPFNQALNELINIFPEKADVKKFLTNNSWINRAKELIKWLHKDNLAPVNAGHKEKILNARRTIWERVLQRSELPVIKSLYALTFAESDQQRFLQISKESYLTAQTKFTFRVYVFALVINNMLDEGLKVFLRNHQVEDTYKAELLWAKSQNHKALLSHKLLTLSNNYSLCQESLNQITDSKLHKYELANYYLLIDKKAETSIIYKTLKDDPKITKSPFYNTQFSTLLYQNSETFYESQVLKYRGLELLDKYLYRENRIKKWGNIFSKTALCELCGGKNTEVVIERPDKQKIVKCIACGLAFLKKMPEKGELENIYAEEYFNQAGISGYTYAYNDQDFSYIFNPRLSWMEINLITRGSKKLLDIGCSNGQFLELARNFGWCGVGIEISGKQHEIALRKGLEVYNCELKEKNFPPESFDCITLWDVLEHYPSPISELKEIFRVLRPDGQLFISTPNHLKGLIKGKNWFGYNASYEHLYYFEASTLIKMLVAAGFKIDECLSYEQGDWEMLRPSNQGHILLVAARK